MQRCARCGRRLKNKRWVFSSHSRNHYCLPGEGCNRPKKRRKRA